MWARYFQRKRVAKAIPVSSVSNSARSPEWIRSQIVQRTSDEYLNDMTTAGGLRPGLHKRVPIFGEQIKWPTNRGPGKTTQGRRLLKSIAKRALHFTPKSLSPVIAWRSAHSISSPNSELPNT